MSLCNKPLFLTGSINQNVFDMKKVLYIVLTLAVISCDNTSLNTSLKYGQGGQNAVQFVKEQMLSIAQNTESIEVTDEDSLLCDIGLMFGINEVNKALNQYYNEEISLKEARAVRDRVLHDGADVENTWRFGSIVTDSLKRLPKYDGQWRKVYSVTIKMKSKTSKVVRVLMDGDGITPRYTDKQFSDRLYELCKQVDIIP